MRLADLLAKWQRMRTRAVAMIDEITTRRLDILLENYVETRHRRHDYISVVTAERAIKQILPDLDVSNRDFDDLIAQRAIKHGLAVHFDRDNTLEQGLGKL
jgi:hypothetical protein